MQRIELTPEEALVLIDFLLRFRDKEVLQVEHPAEQQILWDICAMLESQVPELLDPTYKVKLEQARARITSPDWE